MCSEPPDHGRRSASLSRRRVVRRAQRQRLAAISVGTSRPGNVHNARSFPACDHHTTSDHVNQPARRLRPSWDAPTTENRRSWRILRSLSPHHAVRWLAHATWTLFISPIPPGENALACHPERRAVDARGPSMPTYGASLGVGEFKSSGVQEFRSWGVGEVGSWGVQEFWHREG